LRGSEAILPDRFSSQSTETTINLVWAGKVLSISSIQFLSLNESEAIFPDPIEGSQALQIRSQVKKKEEPPRSPRGGGRLPPGESARSRRGPASASLSVAWRQARYRLGRPICSVSPRGRRGLVRRARAPDRDRGIAPCRWVARLLLGRPICIAALSPDLLTPAQLLSGSLAQDRSTTCPRAGGRRTSVLGRRSPCWSRRLRAWSVAAGRYRLEFVKSTALILHSDTHPVPSATAVL
jgi:hypothetical protein